MTTEIVRELINGKWVTAVANQSGGALPAGGTTGQVLTKLSNADGDADWEAAGGGVAPIEFTWSAAEIEAVYDTDLNTAYMELVGVTTDAVIVGSLEIANTLDVGVLGGSAAYLPSAAQADIDDNGEGFFLVNAVTSSNWCEHPRDAHLRPVL